MAVDAFLWFTRSAGGAVPKGESQDDFFKKYNAFEIKDFSFGIESAHSLGSASGGAGAGKAKFNEFTIKKTTDNSSALFLTAMATGIHYDTVVICIRKGGGDAGVSAGKPYLCFSFSTVFVTKVDWSGPGDEGPEESITFVYGKFGVQYKKQDSTGAMQVGSQAGWDQQINKSWTAPDMPA
jgi:type VI secretion system secreted protein Hcp